MFPVYRAAPYRPDPDFVARANPDKQYLYHKSHLVHLKMIRDTSPDSSVRNEARDQIDLVLDRLDFWSRRVYDGTYVCEESEKIEKQARKELVKRRMLNV